MNASAAYPSLFRESTTENPIPLTRTPCPGWTVRNSVIDVCRQYHRMVPGKYHWRCPARDVCVTRKRRWSAAGLGLGDRHELGHRLPCPCDGWVSRNVTSVCGRAWRTNVIQECGRLSCPDRDLHAKAKKLWSSHGLAFGAHHEKKHALPKTASTVVLHCQDWVITPDGKIGICGNTFIPKKRPSQKDLDHERDAKYGPCHPRGRNKERWERYGFQLKDSVRRTCAYRNCKNGEGGTRKRFDRVKRSPNGKYYCPGSGHHDAENNARKIDRAEARGAKNAKAPVRRKSYTPEEITSAIDSVRKLPQVTNRTGMVALDTSEATFFRWIEEGKLKRCRAGYVYSAQIIAMLDRGLAVPKK